MNEFRSLMFRLANTLGFEMNEETVILYWTSLKHLPIDSLNDVMKRALVDPPFHFPSIQELERKASR